MTVTLGAGWLIAAVTAVLGLIVWRWATRDPGGHDPFGIASAIQGAVGCVGVVVVTLLGVIAWLAFKVWGAP